MILKTLKQSCFAVYLAITLQLQYTVESDWQ